MKVLARLVFSPIGFRKETYNIISDKALILHTSTVHGGSVTTWFGALAESRRRASGVSDGFAEEKERASKHRQCEF